MPFLYNIAAPGTREGRPAGYATPDLERIERERPADLTAAWSALAMVDAITHAHRLTMPVLLEAGALDEQSQPATIRALFSRLPGTRSYVELSDRGHGIHPEYLQMARAWFRLHV